jgi:membrane-associated phospholipid phosphatase
MPITTYIGNGWIFALLLIGLLVLRKYRAFLIGTVVFGLSALICQLLKYCFGHPRPYLYFKDRENLVHFVKGVVIYHNNSFPSGHTTTAFALCCFLIILLKDIRLGIPFFFLAIVTAWSRVYLGEHFFADVYAGSALGVVSAVAICWVADKYFPPKI